MTIRLVRRLIPVITSNLGLSYPCWAVHRDHQPLGLHRTIRYPIPQPEPADAVSEYGDGAPWVDPETTYGYEFAMMAESPPTRCLPAS